MSAKATAKAAAGNPDDPVQALLTAVTKQYGAGSLMQMGSQPIVPVEVIPSGSVGLDAALGIGGLPRGRVVEIYGPESSGKTTLALHAIANAQRIAQAQAGEGNVPRTVSVMIDAEHALDMDYAAALGVDTGNLLLNQPDTGEQALEIADMCVRSGVVDIVVIDSVAALVPRAEIEGMMGDSHMGLQARLMSQALRKITGALGSTRTTVVFINQLREKIGVLFGNPETTTGGKALKFYASVRLDIRRIETLKDGANVYGHRVKIKVVKNKMSPPFREHQADIIYGQGISRPAELIDLAVATGVMIKAGAYYSYAGQVIGQGKDKTRLALEQSPPETMAEIESAVRERMLAGHVVQAPPPPVPAAPADPASLIGSGSLADLMPPKQS